MWAATLPRVCLCASETLSPRPLCQTGLISPLGSEVISEEGDGRLTPWFYNSVVLGK